MRLESKPAATMLLSGVAAVIGGLLMYLARNFSTGGSNVLSGFILGCLLFALGLLGLMIGESRSVELDERRKHILLEVRRRIGGRRQLIIPFNEIAAIAVVALGKSSAGTRYYDLAVRRRDGSEICLFGGCVFEGRMDRGRIEAWRQELERAAGVAGGAGRP